MSLKPWGKNFPSTLDDYTVMPTLVDGSDIALASQFNSMRDSLIQLENKVGSNLLEPGSLRYKIENIDNLHGRDVSSSVPTDGYALVWDAGSSEWQSSKPVPGGIASGDLSGAYPNPIVAKIEGYAVCPTAPTDGYALVWDAGNSQWAPDQVHLNPLNAGDDTSHTATEWQLISMRGPLP